MKTLKEVISTEHKMLFEKGKSNKLFIPEADIRIISNKNIKTKFLHSKEKLISQELYDGYNGGGGGYD